MYPNKLLAKRMDGNDPLSVIPVTTNLSQFFKTLMIKWGKDRGETTSGLLSNLNDLQTLLNQSINAWNRQKNALGGNVSALKGGTIRVPDLPSSPNAETVAANINVALSKGYGTDGVPQEITDAQRAMELGMAVRNSDSLTLFDTRRAGQISARISVEVAEAQRLILVINTIKNAITKESSNA